MVTTYNKLRLLKKHELTFLYFDKNFTTYSLCEDNKGKDIGSNNKYFRLHYSYVFKSEMFFFYFFKLWQTSTLLTIMFGSLVSVPLFFSCSLCLLADAQQTKGFYHHMLSSFVDSSQWEQFVFIITTFFYWHNNIHFPLVPDLYCASLNF